MGNLENVKFRANSESFAEYGHQLCKHNVAGSGNTFIPNFPSAVSLEKSNQVAVANVAVYNATLNITAALGINTLTLSFPSLASCTLTKNSLTMVFSDGYYTIIRQINAYLTQQVAASSYLMRQGAANVTGVQIQQVTNAYTVQGLLQVMRTTAASTPTT